MRNRFDEQLNTLNNELITMGALCEEAISAAVKLLVDNDVKMKESVWEADKQIDQKERDIETLFRKDPLIDTVLLACTHYPLLTPIIQKFLPKGVRLVSQGEIVAKRTLDYLNRHPEIEIRLKKTGKTEFWTTDTVDFFEKGAFLFGERNISAKKLTFSY
jgi:glutamate racemase